MLAHSSNDLYGASKIFLNIIELLINEGYKVYLFLPEKGPLHENNIIKKCNINIIEFGVFRKRYFNFFGLINRSYHIIKSTFEIRSFISKNKIDILREEFRAFEENNIKLNKLFYLFHKAKKLKEFNF